MFSIFDIFYGSSIEMSNRYALKEEFYVPIHIYIDSDVFYCAQNLSGIFSNNFNCNILWK